MWYLEKIEGSNIASFVELSYTPVQGVCTLVFGNNQDNLDNQPSNGSGKSALIEAIGIAFIGEPLRKVGVDEIINDNAEELNIKATLKNIETGDVAIIDRTLSRKGPQVISLTINGNPQVCATVADYNKFILELVGLSKDEIYTNFILTEQKYKSFFASSDKDKKAVINKFSNADLVDKAIEEVTKDMEPKKSEMDELKLAVERRKGAIEVIQSQIDNIANNEQDAIQARDAKKAEFQDRIAQLRQQIRTEKEQQRNQEERSSKCSSVLDEFDVLEANDKMSYNVTYENLRRLINSLFDSSRFKNWTDEASKLHDNINNSTSEIDSITKELEEVELRISKASIIIVDSEVKVRNADENLKNFSQEYQNELAKIEELEKSIEESSTTNHQQYVDYKAEKDNLEIALKSYISCPKCGHKFSLKIDSNIDDVEERISKLTQKIKDTLATLKKNDEDRTKALDKKQSLAYDKAALERKKEEAMVELSRFKNGLEKLFILQDSHNSKIQSCRSKIDLMTKDIETLRTKMFDEAFEIVEDEIEDCTNFKKSSDERIKSYEQMIATYEEQITMLDNTDTTFSADSLKKSLKEEKSELKKVNDEYKRVKTDHDILEEQVVRFTRFKTELANQKITALSQKINGILDIFGSDLKINLGGYQVLKSGKVRDKISVDILRNGELFGSYWKLSKGERVRLDIACVVAMMSLINNNCDNSKGLNLVIMDEIVSGTDEGGLLGIYKALNRLQITTIVVSHTAVAANYQHTLTVTKKNGISTIK